MSSDDIHLIETLRPPNPTPPRPQTNEPVSVHVLDGEETVLFGCGFEAGVDRLIDQLDQLGGPDVIVVEHADPDHYDALPRLIDEYDPIVAVPKLDVDEVVEAVGVTPDVEIEHDEQRWGVRTIHVSGHTPGNMSFIHEASGSLIVGDTFVHKNSFAAASGSWMGSFAPIKPSLNADDEKARRNVEILLDYEFDAAMLTHGLNIEANAKESVEALVADLEGS